MASEYIKKAESDDSKFIKQVNIEGRIKIAAKLVRVSATQIH